MNKYTLLLLTLFLFTGCNNPKEFNKIRIETTDSSKVVSAEINYTDTVVFHVPIETPDSIILKELKHTVDSFRKDSIRRDSLQRINFRKITKKINGGYNGQKDREGIWERAKEVLK